MPINIPGKWENIKLFIQILFTKVLTQNFFFISDCCNKISAPGFITFSSVIKWWKIERVIAVGFFISLWFLHVCVRFLFYLQGNCTDFEATVAAQCDALIEAIMKRKQELLVHVAEERDLKISMLKEQASQCTALLQRTTGLLHFSIEVLKESDPASFLQVCMRYVNTKYVIYKITTKTLYHFNRSV